MLQRDTIETPKRKSLTKVEFAMLFLDQGGLCGCGCGQKMGLGDRIDDEHQIPLAAGGTNDLSNRRLYLKECHKIKTAKDIKNIAKVRRLQGKTGQAKRRKEKGESSIKSRGFDKSITKGFDGKVRKKT